jgi:putative endonuclease
MTNLPPYHYLDIGTAGEDLVAQWLQSEGWVILHRRWRYRNGEIDIIAQHDGRENTETLVSLSASSSSPLLAFVEVKTRSSNNWDAGGRNAITKHKQAKIGDTALMFLAKYPHQADYPCRFDVAIVYCQTISQGLAAMTKSQEAIATSSLGGHLLTLQEYIPAAFDT